MQIRHLCNRSLSLLVALVMTASPLAAQSKGAGDASLRVSVLDPLGAAVFAAEVQLKKAGSKTVAVQTNERGESLFTRLAPGEYQARVEAAGFAARDLDKVIVKAGSNAIEVRLAV